MKTVRSRYREFKRVQMAEYHFWEAQRAEMPILQAMFFRVRRPSQRSVGDMFVFFLRERWMAARREANPVRFLFTAPINGAVATESLTEIRASRAHLRLLRSAAANPRDDSRLKDSFFWQAARTVLRGSPLRGPGGFSR